MTRLKYIIIHWGGKLIRGTCGIDYEGGMTKLIRVRERVNHSQLIEKISTAMKIGLNEKVSKVIFRYPVSTQGFPNFVPLDIEDDDGVEFMFDIFDKILCLLSVQLYVDVDSIPIGTEQQANCSESHIQENGPHTSQSQENEPAASQLHPKDYMQPGPRDTSVLKLQLVHRSEAVWYDTLEKQVLHCRRAGTVAHPRDIDERIVPYLQQAGFYGVARVGFIQLDWHLITSLVERWRPETHTFHLPEGECTITLQDVGILTGLPIDGQAVTGSVTHDWYQVCMRVLGVAPPEDAIYGSRLQLSWLGETFDELPAGADDFTIQCYARAYMLRLIGGVIFPDKSSSRVHLMFLPLLEDFHRAGQYSWGAACLAWLYRELCRGTNPVAKEIGGPLFLVQLWALERLPHIASTSRDNVPQGPHLPPGPLGCQWRKAKIVNEVSTQVLKQYRYALDRQGSDQMTWEPYVPEVVAKLPSYCTSANTIWGAVVPLICFHIVEWHQPDRVMRQFGLQQAIPVPAHQDDTLHTIDLRGNQDVDWATQHASYISLWDDRHNRVIRGVLTQGRLDYHAEYMEWYRKITRRWISPMGAAIGMVADGIEHIYLNSGVNATLDNMADVHQTSLSILHALDEERRTIRVSQRAPEPVQITGLEQEDIPASRRRRRTMADRRQPVEIDLSQPCIPVARPSMLRMVASAAPTSHAARGRRRGHLAATAAQVNDLNSHVVDTTDAPILDDAPTVAVEEAS